MSAQCGKHVQVQGFNTTQHRYKKRSKNYLKNVKNVKK